MTVEVKSEETQIAEVVVSSQQEEPTKVFDVKVDTVKSAIEKADAEEGDAEMKKEEEPKKGEGEEKGKETESFSPSPAVEKSASFKEESNFLADLKENEKKALIELKAKVEEAILEDKLFIKEESKVAEKEEVKPAEEGKEEKEKSVEEGEKAKLDAENVNPSQESKEEEKFVEEGEKEKPDAENVNPSQEGKEEKEKYVEEGEKEKPNTENVNPSQEGEEKEKPDARKEEESSKESEEEKFSAEKEKPDVDIQEKAVEINKDISLWGVPLLPSKGFESTDVILLKFLRAREFKVNEAFEMLRNTLRWRQELKMDSILEEDLGLDLNSVAYMNGVDREGHPVCYNIYGVFENNELYQKTFGTEEKRGQFLRWRLQVMEKGIQKLDFKPGGVSSLLQINDLKNSPGPSKKELRIATKQAVALLQDNYPEFVARNIFVNVPFWYYAFYGLLSPFLTQRTKSKFVFARPAKVTETLLKYITVEDIPICYGGLKRENDTEFSVEDGGVSELIVKSGSSETLEIPAPEVGRTFLWDLTVLGWEVNYKEEFVPTDEGSYTIIVQKGKKMGSHEGPIRNSFTNSEPGKVVLTIGNSTYKKKRVLYRYKVKSSS